MTKIDNRPYEANDLLAWDLAACARQYKVTIREIAADMQITLKRVREVRDSKTKGVRAITAWEFVQSMKRIAARKARV